jgi:hypothetical protein
MIYPPGSLRYGSYRDIELSKSDRELLIYRIFKWIFK